ncbi:hypothetical protein [Komagataeibacter swingsii]|uniref:hypothetical protein n=1 Tax=Komagataeibacter swingsii TaxID=215220 RepID=UPI0011B51B04|nr:hypothetical protein [Komagataeibacter swingsii]
MKLFAKASKERRLFEKKAAPKNFYCFLSMICFQAASYGPEVLMSIVPTADGEEPPNRGRFPGRARHPA